MSFAMQFAHPHGLAGRLAGWFMARANAPLATWALDLLGLAPDATALEIGCGPGRGLVLAAKRVPRGRIIGLDPSPVMRAQAHAHVRRHGLNGAVTLHAAGAEAMPLPAASVDAAFAVNSSPFWRDLPAGLAEAARVLRPGSPLALVVQPRWARGEAAVRELAALAARSVREAGFEHVVTSFRSLAPVSAFAVVARTPV